MVRLYLQGGHPPASGAWPLAFHILCPRLLRLLKDVVSPHVLLQNRISPSGWITLKRLVLGELAVAFLLHYIVRAGVCHPHFPTSLFDLHGTRSAQIIIDDQKIWYLGDMCELSKKKVPSTAASSTACAAPWPLCRFSVHVPFKTNSQSSRREIQVDVARSW